MTLRSNRDDVGTGAALSTDLAPASQSRNRAFDGLRGAACIIVILLHSWTIVPAGELDRLGPLRGLFKSGNLGVIMFFVLGSFLVTRSLVDRDERGGGFDVANFWMRRMARVGSQLYLLVIVLFVVSWFDRWDSWRAQQHQRSLSAISTFTFNLSLVADPSAHREDLGHLWYLSVEQQFYLVWVFVLAWLGRFRAALAVTLIGGVIANGLWRAHVFEQRGSWAAGLLTTTRADGLLLGAFAALVLPHVRRYAKTARLVSLPCLILLAALVLVSAQLDPFAFLKSQGVIFTLVSTILVLAIAVGDDPGGYAERSLAIGPLTFFGRVSFPLYLWHYPVFWASARWASELHWVPRAIGSCIVLAAIVWVVHRLVERPIGDWLERALSSRNREVRVTGLQTSKMGRPPTESGRLPSVTGGNS